MIRRSLPILMLRSWPVLLRTGQLRSIKIGKLRRITEQHLAAFIASREDVADAS